MFCSSTVIRWLLKYILVVLNWSWSAGFSAAAQYIFITCYFITINFVIKNPLKVYFIFIWLVFILHTLFKHGKLNQNTSIFIFKNVSTAYQKFYSYYSKVNSQTNVWNDIIKRVTTVMYVQVHSVVKHCSFMQITLFQHMRNVEERRGWRVDIWKRYPTQRCYGGRLRPVASCLFIPSRWLKMPAPLKTKSNGQDMH